MDHLVHPSAKTRRFANCSIWHHHLVFIMLFRFCACAAKTRMSTKKPVHLSIRIVICAEKREKKSYCYTFSHSGSPCSIVFSVTCVCSISASSSIKDASDISSSSSREAHFPSSDLPFIQSVSRLPGLSYSRFRLSILKHFYFSIIDHSAV